MAELPPENQQKLQRQAGNYSLSLGKVLFKKFGFFFFNFENKKQPFTATAHCSHFYDWQKLKLLPQPTEKEILEVTRNGCAPLITQCSAKPDTERTATADLDKAAVIFNHQSRPSATVLQKRIKIVDSNYKLPGAEGQLHCPRVHQGLLSSFSPGQGAQRKAPCPHFLCQAWHSDSIAP